MSTGAKVKLTFPAKENIYESQSLDKVGGKYEPLSWPMGKKFVVKNDVLSLQTINNLINSFNSYSLMIIFEDVLFVITDTNKFKQR